MRRALIVAVFLFSATARAADVGVTITGPQYVVAGTTATYTITVTNHGPGEAHSVVLSNPTPAHTTMVSFNAPSGWVCTAPATDATGPIDCAAPVLAFGAATSFNATFRIAPYFFGSIVERASITAADDTAPDNDVATFTDEIGHIVFLSLTNVGPATVVAGDSATWTVVATNNGPSSTGIPFLRDTLSPNMTFGSVTLPSRLWKSVVFGDVAICDWTEEWEWRAGTSQTFTVTVNVSPSAPTGSTVTNRAEINSPNPGYAQAQSSALVSTSADLRVTNTGPANAVATSTLAYTLDVTNSGPSDAQTVTLNDAIPAGATLVSLTQTSGPNFVCANATCTLATFASGAHATFALVVKTGEAVGASNNVAGVTSSTSDPNVANNSAASAVNLVAPIPALSPFALLLTASVLAFAAIRRTV